MRVQGDILIERPIEEVFDFVADERNEPKYNAQMTQADKVTPGSIGVGTKFHSFMTGVGGTAEMTVEFIEFIRPKRIVETTHLSTMDINGALYFEPVAEGTRMTWVWDLRPRGFLKFLGPIVGRIGDRQERTIWSGLKRLMESRPEGLRQPQAN